MIIKGLLKEWHGFLNFCSSLSLFDLISILILILVIILIFSERKNGHE